MSNISIQESTSISQSSCTKDERQNGYRCVNSKSLNFLPTFLKQLNRQRFRMKQMIYVHISNFPNGKYTSPMTGPWMKLASIFSTRIFQDNFLSWQYRRCVKPKFIMTPILKCYTDYTILQLSLHATVTAFSSATPGTAFCRESRLRTA